MAQHGALRDHANKPVAMLLFFNWARVAAFGRGPAGQGAATIAATNLDSLRLIPSPKSDWLFSYRVQVYCILYGKRVKGLSASDVTLCLNLCSLWKFGE